MAHKDLMAAWLKDAYAMEQAQIPVLENHAKDARDFPQLQSRIQQHIEETRRHADLVEGCLDRLGEKPSAVKTGLAKVMGNLQSVATGPFRDEIVKNSLADFSAENLEIASYEALIAGARTIGDDQIASTCEQILRDERAMASFIEQNLPTTVQSTLQREAREEAA